MQCLAPDIPIPVYFVPAFIYSHHRGHVSSHCVNCTPINHHQVYEGLLKPKRYLNHWRDTFIPTYFILEMKSIYFVPAFIYSHHRGHVSTHCVNCTPINHHQVYEGLLKPKRYLNHWRDTFIPTYFILEMKSIYFVPAFIYSHHRGHVSTHCVSYTPINHSHYSAHTPL